MKQIAYFSLMLTLLFVHSCSNDSQDTTREPMEHKFQLRTEMSGIELTNINAYLFSKGTLVGILSDLPIIESVVKVKLDVNTQVYFLAGFDVLPNSLTSLEVNKTSINTFLSLCSNPLEETAFSAATRFFTGHSKGSLNADANRHEITMTYSLAHLNLDTSSDPLIKIDRIVANNIPLSSLLFESQANASTENNGTSGTVVKAFETPISGIHKGVIYLYESSSPIPMTIYGTYKQEPITVTISIASIKRNSNYTVKIRRNGASINGSIDLEPWGDGGIIEIPIN